MKRSSSDFNLRSLLAVVVVLAGTFTVIAVSDCFYYKPLCERYAESERLIYHSYAAGWRKKGRPAECFLRDRNGNIERTEVAAIEPTSADSVRWLLSWIATVGGVGGSVWLSSVVGGFKIDKKRKRKSQSIHDT